MAIKNVARGGKGLRAEVTGLKELERKLKALGKDNPALAQNMWRIVGKLGDELRNDMVAAARSAGWASMRLTYKGRNKSGVVTGEDAIKSIFSYGKPKSQAARQKYSALAGVGKPRTMFEWIAAKRPRFGSLLTLQDRAEPAVRRVAPGNPVAMSLAAALEFGTSRMQARPAIRATILASKSRIVASLSEQYKALIDRLVLTNSITGR